MAYKWMVYFSDDGNGYAMKINETYASLPERGWEVPAEPGDRQYPRGWRPRAVYAVSDQGHVIHGVCASPSADLWTGQNQTLTYWNNAGQLRYAPVIGSLTERMLAIRV